MAAAPGSPGSSGSSASSGSPGAGDDPVGAAGGLASLAGAAAGGLTRFALVLAAGLVAFGLLVPDGSSETSGFVSLPPGAPVRLVVPSLQVRADVDPVTVSAQRVLDPPADVSRVGWWDASARPGARSGQTVLTGHAVHTGGGVLDRLPEVREGATVDVVTSQGRLRYRVASVRTYDRSTVAANAGELFGQQGGSGRLVLVSCTDWDGSVYRSNVVVVADALGSPAAA